MHLTNLCVSFECHFLMPGSALASVLRPRRCHHRCRCWPAERNHAVQVHRTSPLHLARAFRGLLTRPTCCCSTLSACTKVTSTSRTKSRVRKHSRNPNELQSFFVSSFSDRISNPIFLHITMRQLEILGSSLSGDKQSCFEDNVDVANVTI